MDYTLTQKELDAVKAINQQKQELQNQFNVLDGRVQGMALLIASQNGFEGTVRFSEDFTKLMTEETKEEQ